MQHGNYLIDQSVRVPIGACALIGLSGSLLVLHLCHYRKLHEVALWEIYAAIDENEWEKSSGGQGG